MAPSRPPTADSKILTSPPAGEREPDASFRRASENKRRCTPPVGSPSPHRIPRLSVLLGCWKRLRSYRDRPGRHGPDRDEKGGGRRRKGKGQKGVRLSARHPFLPPLSTDKYRPPVDGISARESGGRRKPDSLSRAAATPRARECQGSHLACMSISRRRGGFPENKGVFCSFAVGIDLSGGQQRDRALH